MKHILITGANSYLGKSLAAYLGQWPEEFRVDSISVRDDSWKAADFHGYDAIYHTAALVHMEQDKQDPRQASLYDRVNAQLPIAIAEKAKAEGVGQFLFLSTAAVYGCTAPIGKTGTISADTSIHPADNYGASKWKAEQGLRALAEDGFHVAVLRPPMIYGKGCKGNYRTLEAMARKLPCFPAVSNRRSMLYVGNLNELVRLLLQSGEVTGCVGIVSDVTSAERLEQTRRDYVANVSHELRTPLTNVRSYAETIREAGDDLSRETENDFLDVVISETDRMTHIVQDLLTLSRLDSGRSEMNMARFPFSAAIDSVLRSTELEARRHKHELTHDYSENLPLIMGDRGRIEQVMLNVLGNAVKYTPDGGHIRVTAGSEGETVWMEVADDGIGIPEADRSRIFERFYRVDKARSRESGGTGLGLSIATEIVQRHHGTLTLVDRPGPGTTVRLELPITQPVGGEGSHA